MDIDSPVREVSWGPGEGLMSVSLLDCAQCVPQARSLSTTGKYFSGENSCQSFPQFYWCKRILKFYFQILKNCQTKVCSPPQFVAWPKPPAHLSILHETVLKRKMSGPVAVIQQAPDSVVVECLETPTDRSGPSIKWFYN